MQRLLIIQFFRMAMSAILFFHFITFVLLEIHTPEWFLPENNMKLHIDTRVAQMLYVLSSIHLSLVSTECYGTVWYFKHLHFKIDPLNHLESLQFFTVP